MEDTPRAEAKLVLDYLDNPGQVAMHADTRQQLSIPNITPS